MKESFNLPLEESRIIDAKFLHSCPRPTLCILFEDNRRMRHIKTCAIDIREKEIMSGPWSHSNVEYRSNLIIPVPPPLNGIILVGATSISYLNGQDTCQAIEIPHSMISAYTPINQEGTRYLLGDHRGNLIVLALNLKDDNHVDSLVIDVLGKTSIAESISYLDNGVVFIGSALGDSQLIKLHPHKDENGTNIELLDLYSNIGPILDMCLVEHDKQGGQNQLVTCSGAYNDGSLRVIRQGISIDEQVIQLICYLLLIIHTYLKLLFHILGIN